jgi:hypothetical protein
VAALRPGGRGPRRRQPRRDPRVAGPPGTGSGRADEGDPGRLPRLRPAVGR